MLTALCGCSWQVDDKAPKEAEPTRENLQNPARVLPAQEKYIRFNEDSRYVPISKATSGFVLLKDKTPDLPEELVLTEAPVVAGAVARIGGAQRTTGRAAGVGGEGGGGALARAAARAAEAARAVPSSAAGTGARTAPRNNQDEDDDEPAPPESFDFH